MEGEELSKICEAMCYQESVRLLVNAEVVRVEFVKASENPTSSLIDITNAEVQHKKHSSIKCMYNIYAYVPFIFSIRYIASVHSVTCELSAA